MVMEVQSHSTRPLLEDHWIDLLLEEAALGPIKENRLS